MKTSKAIIGGGILGGMLLITGIILIQKCIGYDPKSSTIHANEKQKLNVDDKSLYLQTSDDFVAHSNANVLKSNAEQFEQAISRIQPLSDNLINEMLEPGSSESSIAKAWVTIKDISAGPVDRNNSANLLSKSIREREKLTEYLLESTERDSSTPIWKEYAVQHLGNLLVNSQGEKTLMPLLLKLVAVQHEPIAGTALIQLSRSANDSGDLDSIILGMAQNESAHLSNRITAIAIIGERKITSGKDYLRIQAETAKMIAIKRVAIASLGEIGDETDLEALDKYMTDVNRLVAIAANGARDTILMNYRK